MVIFRFGIDLSILERFENVVKQLGARFNTLMRVSDTSRAYNHINLSIEI